MPFPNAADEGRHLPPDDAAGWEETWWFDAWRADGSLAVTCRLALVPSRRRGWYWCDVVRPGEALVHVVADDVPMPRAGLAVRAHGLWADHVCEAPFEQWTVANEAIAVALDDPRDALGRAYGEAVPVAIDLEWYAAGPPEPTPEGYRQVGEVHGAIELRDGSLELIGPGSRGHTWGLARGCDASPSALPAGSLAPILLPDGSVLEQVLTPGGWFRQRRPP